LSAIPLPFPHDEVDAAARRFDASPPEQILAHAVERFGPRVGFSTGFGVEGCVLIDLIARHRLPVEIFTLDTGLLFDETRALWRALEARYGVRIRAVRPSLGLEQQAALHGPRLWERDPDRCCAMRKVEPLRAALQGLDSWVTAIRRDQTRTRATARVFEREPRLGLVKVNPLASWSLEQVWRHVRFHDVPFNALHDLGYPSIGCVPCTSPVAPGEDLRAGRWRNRVKTECGLHDRQPLAPVVGPSETSAEEETA
jgi:phosphoadenylyl-sulfate reductase (thioredoxin)